MNAALESTVDARNPWLGLASFTEETRAYFFGRDDEVAELARRVQRKLLTVLFGQSGLGKTSILRAGLVPKLRAQGYCPIYVRVDYNTGAPEPGEQIKQVIARTARRSGEWTQSGVAAAGETLWEFLHHRDDVLQDDSGKTLIPLLIFDQFEEIFTLAQGDDAGRSRAARFIEELSDLVENRPPRSLESKLDADEDAAARFDFARSDYRVLIALREDYLAPLEGLKRSMPSIAQNRLRLAPMTGIQGLAAVMKPGQGLVNEEVASAIVRFVADGSEIQNAEVEPALLSLVCRELNDARLAQGRSEISSDLLDGSQNTILSNFYERSLSDQPPAARQIIEDQLLTVSGFRENIAEERLVTAFKAAGIPPETLSTLVNRRLLRIEERLDVRRVELTHDVLCSVVQASRDLRLEREAREAAERLLSEQRDKAAAARRALLRARQVAGVCALLALVAVIAAIVAVFSTQRARRAEAATQQARVQAEGLVGYLSDDFSTELETYGKLSTISEIAKRQIDYFHGLPPSLKGVDSIRNGAMAMTTYASASRTLGQEQQAGESVREAITLLERARSQGDASEATGIALARAYDVLSEVLSIIEDPKVLEAVEKADLLIEPIASAPNASMAARKAQTVILTHRGYEDSHFQKRFEAAREELQRALDLAASLGGREVQTPEVGAMYADAATWLTEVLDRLGRQDEAWSVAVEGHRVGRKVLELRPEYGLALHATQVSAIDLGDLSLFSRLDPATAYTYGEESWQLAQAMLKRDADSGTTINNAGVALLSLSTYAWTQGKVTESFGLYRRAIEIQGRVNDSGAWYVLNSLSPAGTGSQKLADAGEDAEARRIVDGAVARVAGLKKAEAPGSRLPVFATCAQLLTEAGLDFGLGNLKAVAAKAAEARRLVQDLEPDAPFEGLLKYTCDFLGPQQQAEAELMLGQDAAAERSCQYVLSAQARYPPAGLEETRQVSMVTTLMAMAKARQGHQADGAALVAPQVRFQRDLAARNKGDVTQTLDLAKTLYVASLTDASRRAALKRESLALIDSLPLEFRKLRSTTRWRQLIENG